MGEEKSSREGVAGEGKHPHVSTEERHPLTGEHLYVITELAKLGLVYLKFALPEFAKVQGVAGREDRETYEHLKSLYDVAGPETLRHFNEMCQYLYEQKKSAGDEGK